MSGPAAAVAERLTKTPSLGILVPTMGAPSGAPISIADALFTKTQQKVLATLFGQPDRSFYANEIVRLAASGIGAVQRELQSLESSGLVTARRRGNQKHYQANPAAPVFEELRSLVAKTFGVADRLRQALAPLAPNLEYACVYGSVAKGTAHAASDIDLLLVGDGLTLEDVFAAVAPAENQLGRKVSPVLYGVDEFGRRRKAGNAFTSKVIAGVRIPLIGSLDGNP